jgi:hypothetical protein
VTRSREPASEDQEFLQVRKFLDRPIDYLFLVGEGVIIIIIIVNSSNRLLVTVHCIKR